MDIRLIKISKSFGEKQVLKDVTMTFPDQRASCIMGPSGSGKTTLINVLLGLISPDTGKMEGMEDKRLSAVFQEDRLIEHWDAVKNIQLVCNKDVTEAMIHSHLREVGLSDYQGKMVRSFSGGMRRRVAIVRAILSLNNLVIMDEPFKGLDSSLKLQVIQYVKEHTKNKTLIFITHDQEEVALLEAELFTISSI